MTLTTRELDGAGPAVAAPSGTARGMTLPRGPRRSRRRRWWGLATLAVVAVATVDALGSGDRLVKAEGAGAFGEFFAAALTPRADAEFLALIGTATVTTLGYAVLGTALSLVIGLVGGVLTSQTWWAGRRRGWLVARAVLVVPRGIHEVIWGLALLLVFGLDPLVAVLAIGIPFGAVTAKVFSELLDETGSRPYEALLAAGVPRRTAVLYGLLPPALPDLLSYAFYRFECAIRSAAILGLVGAGGLGYQLLLSFQTLRYDELWTSLYALIVLSVAADSWSGLVRRRRFRRVSLAAAAALIVFSAWWVGLGLAGLFSGRVWQSAGELLGDAWPPALPPGGVGELISLATATLAMSVVAIAIAFSAGSLLALPAARLPDAERRVPSTLLRALTKLFLVVLRAIPPPVWALLLLFLLYPGILPGALALGVYTAGVLGRLMAEAAENLDAAPLRALRSHGAGGAQVLCYGVLPAATPRFVAYGLYRWEVTIRETVVVGVVGAGGLGDALRHTLAAFDYAGALTIVAVLVALTFAVDLVSAGLRTALR